jgi:hypothetical protein
MIDWAFVYAVDDMLGLVEPDGPIDNLARGGYISLGNINLVGGTPLPAGPVALVNGSPAGVSDSGGAIENLRGGLSAIQESARGAGSDRPAPPQQDRAGLQIFDAADSLGSHISEVPSPYSLSKTLRLGSRPAHDVANESGALGFQFRVELSSHHRLRTLGDGCVRTFSPVGVSQAVE